MNYEAYKRKASMGYSEKTIRDRKSFIRLFDVWLRGLRGDFDDPKEVVRLFKGMDRKGRVAYQFSDYEPQAFDEIEEFIFFLYNDLDYSRTMARHYFDAIQSYCDRLNLEVFDPERFQRFREDNLQTQDNPHFDQSTIFTLEEVTQLVERLDPPAKNFALIQYLHCRRPGEVKELQVSSFDFDQRTVTYPIKKQKYGDDNLIGSCKSFYRRRLSSY